MRRALSLLALALMPANALHADAVDGTMIVHRGEDAVELYASIDALNLTPWLNGDTAIFTEADGSVDFSNFLVDTAFMGDALFGAVEARVAGEAAQFYAMSFMLHPQDLEVEFDTPWAALSSITFCSVAPSQGTYRPDTLRSYVGLAAYPVDGLADVSFTFPETGRGALTFEVREYLEGAFFQRYQVTLEDGAVFSLEPIDGPPVSQAATAVGGWFFYLGVMAVVALSMARPVRPAPKRRFNI